MLRYLILLMIFSFFCFANIPPQTTYINDSTKNIPLLNSVVREGIYMWVGKSNDNIDARIKDHIKKRFNGAEKLLKQLLRIDVKLPAQLLETMEQAIMDIMGYTEPKHGDSANRRNNYNPKKHYRKNGYRRFKKMLKSLCK